MSQDIHNYRLDHKLRVKRSVLDDPLYYLTENDLDLQSNHIYLMSIDRGYDMGTMEEPGIDYLIANRFIKNINVAMRVNSEKPLLIHQKTCGGSWVEGIAIYDTIKSFPWPVTILNYTHARSMSSLIFQAGNKRVMMPNSYFMLHDGTWGVDGTLKQINSAMAFDRRTADKIMMGIYVKAMKRNGKLQHKTEPQIEKWLRDRMDKEEDVYFTAQEAVEYGLADQIFDSDWKSLTVYTDEQLQR